MEDKEQPIGGGKVETPPDPLQINRPIDKWDWFGLLRTWLTTSDDRMKAQAQNIQDAVKWFFTICTSSAILTFVVKSPNPTKLSALLFSVALVLLFFAYGLAVKTYSTLSRTVDMPDNADQIREEFNKSNNASQKSLRLATLLMIIGMGFFPAAVLSLYQNPTAAAPAILSTLNASMTTYKDKNNKEFISRIEVSGNSADSSFLNLRLLQGNSLASAVSLMTFRHVLGHARFDYSVPMDSGIVIDPKLTYYLIRTMKEGTDTLKSLACKIQR